MTTISFPRGLRALSVLVSSALLFSVHAWCSASSPDAAVPSASLTDGALARWTFDESSGGLFLDTTPHQHHAQLKPSQKESVQCIKGVFGKAASFSGPHSLEIPTGRLQFSTLNAITFSAWVKPTDLGGYKEIFRKEDGSDRILFSFQHNGTILSLGLNIGGYVECDAPTDPRVLLDGNWHHAAASFDGKQMRVYLDGREIHHCRRPGTIRAGGGASSFIGSSGGAGEHFQGAIDDLVIVPAAVDAKRIAAEYQHGITTVYKHVKKEIAQLKKCFVEKPTFAETLAATRRNLKEKKAALSSLISGTLTSLLTANFSEQYKQFVEVTASDPLLYLQAEGNSWNLQQAERTCLLMNEYMPLTEMQWSHASAQERKHWRRVESLLEKFEALKKEGAASAASPEWIELIIEGGSYITPRPVRHEPVAPYVTPYTPETKDLSREQADTMLEEDWLFQAGNKPDLRRLQNEIAWTRHLASRIQKQHHRSVDFSRELTHLSELEKRSALPQAEYETLYLSVRRIKRTIMFKNPVIDFDAVLFVDIPYPKGSEWPHETRHRLGYMGGPGGRLLILKDLSPAGHLTRLMPQEPLHGTFWRPDLSFDAKRVLVSFKPANEKNFHLYEINSDGTGLRQITHGIYDDVDPIYLPDGKHIIFVSTRGHNYVRCMPPTNSFVITRCDLSGKNMYIISRNNEPDYLPAVMPDGRIIYTRWEYTDKPLWRAQSLWTMNPDGTRPFTFWGNQSVWPDLIKDARPIPGSSRVMFTGAAHHNWFAGSIGIIDHEKGLNFPDGLTKVTAEVSWPESGNGPVDPVESENYHRSGAFDAYQNPYPLSEHDFLVSARRNGSFRLYLMDTDGNKELIYKGAHHILHAMPFKKRTTPPVIPEKVDWPSKQERLDPKPGLLYSNNIYHNTPTKLRGKAKYLRLLSIDPKTYTYWYKRPYASTGPVVSMIASEGVKRIIGTVPIEEDGSVCFEAPSGKALHFQLLDDKFRALQTMRSFTGVMPGEKRGCLGCHELHSVTPDTDMSAKALLRKPSRITPPPWGDASVSYPRFVQPVLDKYCGECHQGDGKKRKEPDLTFRPGYSIFNEPYVLLTGHPSWGRPYNKPDNPPPGFGIADTLIVEGYHQRDPAAYITLPPMTKLSYKSRLVEIASSGTHYDVTVDPISRRQLIAWVDTMCPYRGEEEIRAIPDPEFQGIDWLSIRPQIKSAPDVVRPGPIEEGIGYSVSATAPDPGSVLAGAADPTIIAAPAGKPGWYVYATGRGLPFYYSKDLVHWERKGRVFSSPVPSWARKKVPGTRGIWAPHITRINGLYYLYYSCSTFGKQRSVIGLAVNKTIDPDDEDYEWIDRGEVIASVPGSSFNAIDPAAFLDTDGRMYLFWGSFWSGLKAIELDPATGKPKKGAKRINVVDRREPPNAVEAPYVIKRGGLYYLFVSFDSCCDGARSTYRVMVGRSEKITGPYRDARGRSLLEGGGTLVVASDARWRGPGHNSILKHDGKDWLVHHTYDMKHLNRHRILQVRPLYWQEEMWPVAGQPLVLTHDKPKKKITESLILGTWRQTVDYREESARTIELAAGGKIRNASAGSSWKLEGNKLTLSRKPESAPGGERIDEVLVEPAGGSYIGRNQNFQVVCGRRID